jgi:hypothetical protein
MVGLHYLRYMFDLSDESIVWAYIVNTEKPKHLPKIGTLEAIKGYNNNQET